MNVADILADAASRVPAQAASVLAGISQETLHAMPNGANSIAWLIWHAARQLDLQLADLTSQPQVWEDGWSERLGVPRGSKEIGFGDGPDDVEALRIADPEALEAYLKEAVDAYVAYVRTLSETDLDVVIDTSWDPHVTRGVRLVSLVDDATVHLGQAAYARGVVEHWSIGF